jgi:hypothetical protein
VYLHRNHFAEEICIYTRRHAPLPGGDTHSYPDHMPNQPKTKAKPIRIPPELWEAAGAAATEAGTDRSALIRDFFTWFTRRPGGKPLKRPEAGSWSDPANDAPASEHAPPA